MPPKPSKTAAQRANLAQARAAIMTNPTLENLQCMLSDSQHKLFAAEKQIVGLELALESERNSSTKYAELLQEQLSQCAHLAELLATEHDRSQELYRQLHVERRARQRGNARKSHLDKQIHLLKSAEIRSSDHVKQITKNASRSVDLLIKVEKENSTLKAELSQSIEQFKAKVASSKEIFAQLTRKLRETKLVANRLQKQQIRAVVVREKAVHRAREQAIGQRSFHKLLHKGT